MGARRGVRVTNVEELRAALAAGETVIELAPGEYLVDEPIELLTGQKLVGEEAGEA